MPSECASIGVSPGPTDHMYNAGLVPVIDRGQAGTTGLPLAPVRLRRDSRVGRAVTWRSAGKRVAQRQSKEFRCWVRHQDLEGRP
jgi:hypothetical protein